MFVTEEGNKEGVGPDYRIFNSDVLFHFNGATHKLVSSDFGPVIVPSIDQVFSLEEIRSMINRLDEVLLQTTSQ
jgi:hypothetical protein